MNEDKDEQVDNLLVRNLKALEEICTNPLDEEDLFGHQVAATLRRFTARQKAQAKLRIQVS